MNKDLLMTNSTHGALGYSTNSELARAEQKLKAAERHRDEIQFDILDLNSGIGGKSGRSVKPTTTKKERNSGGKYRTSKLKFC